ncbi:MAG TPA: Hsp20/alpha crystallin family protein [Gemmatimonadaceae bacterium]|nr:Hsp20/alpha crystallin family protein [Gemmatimonadaceae bacterium]
MHYRNNFNAPVFGLRREIDKLFEDTFGGREGGNNTWTPAVDIKENQNELTLDVELPGINPENVEITTDSGVLTVRGEKHSARKEDEQSRFHVVERTYGSFTRSFQLPSGVDESRIEATCDNGILSIHIPKAALPQPKKIEIKSGGVGNQRQMSSTPGSQSQQGQGQRRINTGDSERQQQPMAANGTNTGSKSTSKSSKATEARS